MDSHRAINTNDIQFMPGYITVKYGESQATPRVTLRLGGYDDMTQQVLPVSANLKTPGQWRQR